MSWFNVPTFEPLTVFEISDITVEGEQWNFKSADLTQWSTGLLTLHIKGRPQSLDGLNQTYIEQAEVIATTKGPLHLRKLQRLKARWSYSGGEGQNLESIWSVHCAEFIDEAQPVVWAEFYVSNVPTSLSLITVNLPGVTLTLTNDVKTLYGRSFEVPSSPQSQGIVNGYLTILQEEAMMTAEIRRTVDIVLGLWTVISGARLIPVEEILTTSNYIVASQHWYSRPTSSKSSPIFSDPNHWGPFVEEVYPQFAEDEDARRYLAIVAHQITALNNASLMDFIVVTTCASIEGLCLYLAEKKYGYIAEPRDEGFGFIRKLTHTKSNMPRRFDKIVFYVAEQLGRPFTKDEKEVWTLYRNHTAHRGSFYGSTLHDFDERFRKVMIPLRQIFEELVLRWLGYKGSYFPFTSKQMRILS